MAIRPDKEQLIVDQGDGYRSDIRRHAGDYESFFFGLSYSTVTTTAVIA